MSSRRQVAGFVDVCEGMRSKMADLEITLVEDAFKRVASRSDTSPNQWKNTGMIQAKRWLNFTGELGGADRSGGQIPARPQRAGNNPAGTARGCQKPPDFWNPHPRQVNSEEQ